MISGKALLYSRVEALSAAAHDGLAVTANAARFAVARRAPLVPLTLGEFALFADVAPIVLVGAALQPMLVCSADPNRNGLVEADGTWREGVRLPGYLERLPFAFAQHTGGAESVLCVDVGSPMIVPVGTRQSHALFDGNALSEHLMAVAAHCVAYAEQEAVTRETVAAWWQRELLTPMRANRDGADGTSTLLLTYAAVDPERFARMEAHLPDDERTAIAAHLRSLRLWEALPER